MRNAVSLLKHYPPQRDLSRTDQPSRSDRTVAVGSACARISACRRWSRLAAVLLVAASASVSTALGDSPPQTPDPQAHAGGLQLPGRPAPGLAAIFLPSRAPAGSYQLTVLDLPLAAARDRLLAALAPGARVEEPAGAWTVVQTEPGDAYGNAGRYDRSRLARLYAGRRPSIVRAPILRNGRVVASLTLISPHPDPELTRLSPGTMAILFLVDAARR